jgi:Cyclic nucleotide-binding domain.
MEQYLDTLISSRLFYGMDKDQAGRLLACLGTRVVNKEAGEYFIMQDNASADISIIVQGRAIGERISADGVIAVVNEFFPGDVFGDVLSGASVPNFVGVRAVTQCTAVVFELDNILEPCADVRAQQKMLARNLIGVISDKYFVLNARVSILLCKSLRGKIAGYLVMQAKKAGSDAFDVTHNREEMARFIGCERSALSREISRMAAQKLFAVDRNSFTIPDRKKLEDIAGR